MRTALATWHFGRNVAEKITIPPANRSLIFPKLHQSRCRGTAIGFRQRIQRLNDVLHFALQRRKVGVIAVTQIRCLFCPGLHELSVKSTVPARSPVARL